VVRDLLLKAEDCIVSPVAESSLLLLIARSQFVSSENRRMPTADYQPIESSNREEQRELAPPHFDERAVATAHPVQPLSRRGLSRWQRLALVFAAAAACVVAVFAVTTFLIIPSPQSTAVDTPTADTQAAPSPEATQPQITAAATESSATHRNLSKPKSVRRHSNSEAIQTVVVEKQGKPVARKVGVITYGHSRSSDRP